MICIESIKNGQGKEIGIRWVYRKGRAYYIKSANQPWIFSQKHTVGWNAGYKKYNYRWVSDKKIADYLSRYLSFRDVEITLHQLGE